MQFHPVRRGVRCGAWLVHPKMPVETHAEDRQVKSLPDGRVKLGAHRVQVVRFRGERVKLFGPQINMINQIAPDHVCATPGIFRRQPPILVQHENL